MIRTQIQLTEEQAGALKELAARRNESMAELIRQAIALLLQSSHEISREQRIAKAREIAGRFVSEQTDFSENHDAYLFEEHRP
ncbi:MAG: CopG family transcriptional regulator [Candidatus Xenobiia bacterium LiM19]